MPSSADSHAFKDFVLDQLIELRGVRARAMFGGHGLYLGDVFFGIVHRERLYLKTTSASVDDFVVAGMECFRPSEKQVLKNYYEVPAHILERSSQLIAWAKRSAAG